MMATLYVNNDLGTDDAGHGGSINAGAWATIGYAVSGSRMSKGDTLEVQQSTVPYTEGATITVAFGAGAGGVTIKNYGSDVVTFNQGAGNPPYAINTGDGPITFEGINFTNSDSTTICLFLFNDDSTFIFNDCTFDNNSVASASNGLLLSTLATAGTLTLEFNRCKLKHIYGYIVRLDKTAGTINITANSCEFIDVVSAFGIKYPTNITLKNNTYAVPYTNGHFIYDLKAVDGSHIFNLKNNIISTAYNGVILLQTKTVGELISTPANWDVKNNILWQTGSLAGGSDPLNLLVTGANEVVRLDISNILVNPGFVDAGAGDVTLSGATSWAAGRGAITELPSTDINGDAWRAADVGCYTNPAKKLLTLAPFTVAFAGDSTSAVTGINGTAGYFASLMPALTVPDPTVLPTAKGGMQVNGLRFLIDRIMTEVKPRFVYINIGINNLGYSTGSARSPVNISDQQIADITVLEIMKKVAAWGGIPVVTGFTSQTDSQVNCDSVIDKVEALCITNGFRYHSLLDYFRQQEPINWATVYWLDLSSDVHYNTAGQQAVAVLAKGLYVYPDGSCLGMGLGLGGGGGKIPPRRRRR